MKEKMNFSRKKRLKGFPQENRAFGIPYEKTSLKGLHKILKNTKESRK